MLNSSKALFRKTGSDLAEADVASCGALELQTMSRVKTVASMTRITATRREITRTALRACH